MNVKRFFKSLLRELRIITPKCPKCGREGFPIKRGVVGLPKDYPYQPWSCSDMGHCVWTYEPKKPEDFTEEEA